MLRHLEPRTLALRFLIASCASALLLAVMVTGVNWQLDNRIAGIERLDVTVDTTPRPAKAGNYLMIGSDSREFVDDEPDALEAFGDPDGARADTILIAHVEPEQEEVFVVSIPRDTVVDLPEGGRSKIADVFNDGPQALIDAIDANFDVPITHYLNVDFAGFDRIVDLVGPVPVWFDHPARDEKAGLHIEESGCVELDAEQALAYVRSRQFEQLIYGSWFRDPRADLGRIERQQTFLRQVALVVRERIYAEPLDVPAIVEASLATVQADREFGRDQILGFIDHFRDVEPYDPRHVEMITLPVVDGPPGTALGAYLELAQPAADEVLERLRTFGAGPTPADADAEDPTTPPDAPLSDPPAPPEPVGPECR